MTAPASRRGLSSWQGRHFAALLIANISLGIGPLFVRLADTGPAATGFWRHLFALPILAALMLWRVPAVQMRLRGNSRWLIPAAGVLFGLNLVFAYTGFAMTRLGNIVLLGNSGGLLLMAWAIVAARRIPKVLEMLAISAAIGGAWLLLAGSVQISYETFRGDLMGIGSGVCYAAYLLLLKNARAQIDQFTLLFWVTLSSLPVLLAIALASGEQLMADNWWPIIVLTITGHLIGQGLLIYSLRYFSALVIGLVLLTQPAISAAIGWIVFDEVLSPLDVFAMALLGAALVMARANNQQLPPPR